MEYFASAGGAKLGVAAERDGLKINAMWAAIHGATEWGISTVDDFFDIFHDNRSGFYNVFNDFVMVSKYFLYHIHEIIMG